MPDRVAALERLRGQGWSVAVHNDYRQDGVSMTFWLLTHSDGRYVKGEAPTDAGALAICLAAVEQAPATGAIAGLRAALDQLWWWTCFEEVEPIENEHSEGYKMARTLSQVLPEGVKAAVRAALASSAAQPTATGATGEEEYPSREFILAENYRLSEEHKRVHEWNDELVKKHYGYAESLAQARAAIREAERLMPDLMTPKAYRAYTAWLALPAVQAARTPAP